MIKDNRNIIYSMGHYIYCDLKCFDSNLSDLYKINRSFFCDFSIECLFLKLEFIFHLQFPS